MGPTVLPPGSDPMTVYDAPPDLPATALLLALINRLETTGQPALITAFTDRGNYTLQVSLHGVQQH